MLSDKQVEYITKNVENLQYRKFLLDTFTPQIPGEPVDESIVKIPIREEFVLKKGHIVNYNGPDVTTNVGIFITNAVALVIPLGTRIDYVNEPFTSGAINKLNDQIIDLLLATENDPDMPEDKKMTVELFYYYWDSLIYIGHIHELGASGYSPKSLTTDPNIAKRAAELYELHKDELDDQKVVAAIEQELIQMDKDWIKGDIGSVFHDATGGKSYNVHRKSLFITQGAIPKFDKDETGTLLVKPSLQDGVQKEDFAAVANNTRRGSYGRGKSTALGGYLTKIMYRVFGSLKVLEEDCGSKEGVEFVIDNPKQYIGRNIITPDGILRLTSTNISEYVGKKVTMRDPLYCKTKNGYCYTCLNDTVKALKADVIVSQIAGIGSTILYFSMKAMHGQSLKIIKTPYEDYFVEIE